MHTSVQAVVNFLSTLFWSFFFFSCTVIYNFGTTYSPLWHICLRQTLFYSAFIVVSDGEGEAEDGEGIVMLDYISSCYEHIKYKGALL